MLQYQRRSRGNRMGDVSFQLQNVAESAGFSVLQNFSGHGIGRNLHEEPQVPTTGSPGRGVRLRPGMVLAIEAMVNAGNSSVGYFGRWVEHYDVRWEFVCPF